MEGGVLIANNNTLPDQIATPRRSSVSSTSTAPEFEFWSSSSMMNVSDQFSSSPLLTADELFVDGVLIPLHLLSPPSPDYNDNINHLEEETNVQDQLQLDSFHDSNSATAAAAAPDKNCREQLEVIVIEQEKQEQGQGQQEQQKQRELESPSIALITSCLAPVSASKRWRDIFRKNNDNNREHQDHQKDAKEKDSKAERRKERKNSSTIAGAAELNINIWPFSRSRSAGTGGTPRPKTSLSSRRVSSAPCSRSNSRGESSSSSSSSSGGGPAAATATVRRRCAASPGRAGVPVGRISPVWQMRRNKPIAVAAGGRKINNCTSSSGNGLKALNLNLNVNTCIRFTPRMSCRRDDRELHGESGGGGGRSSGNGGGEGSSGGSLFSLKTMFSKKVIY